MSQLGVARVDCDKFSASRLRSYRTLELKIKNKPSQNSSTAPWRSDVVQFCISYIGICLNNELLVFIYILEVSPSLDDSVVSFNFNLIIPETGKFSTGILISRITSFLTFGASNTVTGTFTPKPLADMAVSAEGEELTVD
jgi:hypothetical protein